MSTETIPNDNGATPSGTASAEPLERKKNGFIRRLFSHLVVAAIAVAGAAAYFHWTGMMSSIEGYVCSEDMLGRYAATPDKGKAMTGESAVPQAPAVQSSGLMAPDSLQYSPADPFEAAWLDARRAYWDDGARAVGAYRSLIAKRPHVPGPYGELGNVYFQAGDNENAAGQYYLAGKRYLAEGNLSRVGDIVAILEQIDPARAVRLSQILNGGG